jgi:hypothetical protein
VRLTVGAVFTAAVAILCFTVPAFAVDSFFDIDTDLPVSGFFPTLVEQIAHMQNATFIHELEHRIDFTYVSGNVELPLEVMLSNGAPPGPDTWTTNSFFDITYRPNLNPQPFPPSVGFGVFNAFFDPNGELAQLVPIHPGNPDPYVDVSTGDSFFDIVFRVDVGPGGGCHEMHMHGQVTPGFHLGNVNVNSSGNSVNVSFTLEPMVEVNTVSPLARITTTGQYISAPVAVRQASWGKVKSLYRT